MKLAASGDLSSSLRLLVLTNSTRSIPCLAPCRMNMNCFTASLQLPLVATRPARSLPHIGFTLVVSLLSCQALLEALEMKP